MALRLLGYRFSRAIGQSDRAHGMASPDYIDVVGGVYGRSYEDVTFFLHFLTSRILACAFRVARVEATTLRVAPVTSDLLCTAIYCSSVARARIYGNLLTLWHSYRIKSMGNSQLTCSLQSCHGFKDRIWTLCLARYSLWAMAQMLEVFCSPAAYSMPHLDSYGNDTSQQPGRCTHKTVNGIVSLRRL